MKRLALSTILISLAALLASGCVYKMTIQQGNYLVPDSVAQLKEGMTRSQVRFLLGTPMVPDAFDDSRWDYFYYFTSQKQRDPLKRRLTIYFQDERVQRFENNGVPTQADLAQLEKDLQRAIAATQKKREGNVFKRMFGKDKPGTEEAPAGATTEPAPTTAPSDPNAPPNPVPASQPLPAPAGTPSGQP